MNVVITLNIVAVLFALFESKRIHQHGLKVAFFLIFLFLALRYNYGNDYISYFEGFDLVNQFNSIDYFDLPEEFHFEVGWVFLNRLFEPLGFFSMIAFLAAFNTFVFYRFIKKYVPREYYWFATFLYVFTPEFMLIHSSAMRQTVAISLFLIAFDFLFEKKYINYVLIILLASIFHKSAIILLGCILLTYRIKINPPILLIGIIFFILNGLFLQDLFLFIIKNIISSNESFERYNVYLDTAGTINTGFGIALNMLYLIIILIYATKINALVAKLAGINYLLYPFSLSVMMIGRIGFFFQPFIIIIFAHIMQKNKHISIMISFLIISSVLFYFYIFFQSPVWIQAFSEYKTIFSHR